MSCCECAIDKHKIRGRCSEQNLDIDVFLTGEPQCHPARMLLRERYEDDATSIISTSTFFRTGDLWCHPKSMLLNNRYLRRRGGQHLDVCVFLQETCSVIRPSD